MKSRSLIITLIVILSCFALALAGGFVFLLFQIDNFNFRFNFNDSNVDLIDSYSIDFKEVNKVYFNLYSTDVEIKESEDNRVVVEYYSNQEKNPKIEFSGNTLKVDESNFNFTCVGFCNSRRKIVLYLPIEFNVDFDIITKSGDIKSDVALSKINFSTMSGDVFLDDVFNAFVSTVSGDVLLGKTNEFNVSTTSGDIKVKDVSDILNISTTSGDVLIDVLDIKKESSIKTVSGDVVVNSNVGNCYVDFDTTSGDARINKIDRKSDIVLMVKTVSGDISVD